MSVEVKHTGRYMLNGLAPAVYILYIISKFLERFSLFHCGFVYMSVVHDERKETQFNFFSKQIKE